MKREAVSEFFNMGGYGAFIWPAYAISALVLIVLLVQSRRRLSRLNAELTELEAARPRLRRRKS